MTELDYGPRVHYSRVHALTLLCCSWKWRFNSPQENASKFIVWMFRFFFLSSKSFSSDMKKGFYIRKKVILGCFNRKKFVEKMLHRSKIIKNSKGLNLVNGAGRREAKEQNHTPESGQWRHCCCCCYWTQDAKAFIAGHHCNTIAVVAMETWYCCCGYYHWLNGVSTVPASSDSRSGQSSASNWLIFRSQGHPRSHPTYTGGWKARSCLLGLQNLGDILTGDLLTLKMYFLFMWTLNLAGHPIFLFDKSDNTIAFLISISRFTWWIIFKT